jgi:hypothetical protein
VVVVTAPDELTPAMRAALYGGASAAVAALTLRIGGATAEALEPLKGLTPTQLWCAHAELLAIASEALVALGEWSGKAPEQMVADLGLGVAARFG